ncbi:MAG: hypothetical protein Q4G60_10580 [bacterium]|nr:hypothetical protein [bacterium]
MGDNKQMDKMDQLEIIIVDFKNSGLKLWTVLRMVSEIYKRSKKSSWQKLNFTGGLYEQTDHR